MNESNINLKHLLNRLFDLKENITALYQGLKLQLGPEATFVREWADLHRIERDGTDSNELEGDTLIADVVKFVWSKGVDYVWHYKGYRFRITPFNTGFGGSGVIFYYGEKHSQITFQSVADDVAEFDTPIWDAVCARIYGMADGYVSAMKDSLRNEENLKKAVQDGRLTKVLADQPAPDAEPVPDGTLACGDKPAEPVDQAEKPNRLIRAGGPSPERYG